MKVQPREAVLAMATGLVALFGGTALLARPKITEWKDLRKEQASVLEEIGRDRQMVAEKDAWTAKLAERSQMLPVFAPDKKMDVHWLLTMENLASKNGVTILKRQAGEEKREGDVYELPIECLEWEGTLDALVKFLFALQSEGAMLDIRQLFIKPKEKAVLRGRFILYCAYTKEKK